MHESGEMYLETILILSKEIGNVRSIDICEYMGYSKPSISRAMGLLKNNDYITIDNHGYIKLTDSGRQIAESIYERHNVLTEALTIIGVDPKIAEDDACKIEHCITDETLNAVKAFIAQSKQ